MASTIGHELKLTVFGQSHSEAIGGVLDGFPSGFAIDRDHLDAFMARRAPGQGPWATKRKEADAPRFLSGLNREGNTSGAPLAYVIENSDTRPQDYDQFKRIPRPGHADFTAQARYGGNQDASGGGHFSGRLTAPICVAGALCRQYLKERGVTVSAHILSVAGIADEPFHALRNGPYANDILDKQMADLEARWNDGTLPVIDGSKGEAMAGAIENARKNLDSVGGVIQGVVTGYPKGVGEPLFDKVEALLGRMLFAIPAVRGVEFGRGFALAGMRGSEANDPFSVVDGDVRPLTNNAGGTLGGITSGAPILCQVAVKPTASIGREQQSVDLERMEPSSLYVKGRHDPSIVPRAVPVVEAVMAFVLLDCLLSFGTAR